VIPNFMIQGGGITADMRDKPSKRAPIKNEANNGLKNDRGTIAMARTSDPHSATSQFFINLKDNDFLNFRSESMQGWGYAVFGKVTDGMNIVDEIAKVRTGNKGGHQDVPAETITITGVKRQ
jgi:peptidyl-prolyl cis-trans isomerase B (cyclophilin B)